MILTKIVAPWQRLAIWNYACSDSDFRVDECEVWKVGNCGCLVTACYQGRQGRLMVVVKIIGRGLCNREGMMLLLALAKAENIDRLEVSPASQSLRRLFRRLGFCGSGDWLYLELNNG